MAFVGLLPNPTKFTQALNLADNSLCRHCMALQCTSSWSGTSKRVEYWARGGGQEMCRRCSVCTFRELLDSLWTTQKSWKFYAQLMIISVLRWQGSINCTFWLESKELKQGRTCPDGWGCSEPAVHTWEPGRRRRRKSAFTLLPGHWASQSTSPPREGIWRSLVIKGPWTVSSRRLSLLALEL